MYELVARVLHDNGGVVGDALFLREQPGHTDAPVLQERGGGLFRQFLVLTGKEAIIFPEGKAAGRLVVISLAEKALLPFHHVLAAARTLADDWPARMDRCRRSRRRLIRIGLDKRIQHLDNAGEKVGRGERAALYLAQLFLPLCRQLRGFKRVG